MQRTDGDQRHLDDLAQIAHQLLDEFIQELRWKRDMGYGPVKGDTAGVVSGGGVNDPTQQEATTRHGLRKKVGAGMRDMRWLVDRKLPEMLGKLELEDDRPLMADEERDADVSGGVSAYRGDRKPPAGRADLKEALSAQRRRIERGDGYGRG